jgi:hypothetical protein
VTSPTDRTAGEVDWPAAFERTPPGDRARTSKFSVTFHEAVKSIQTQLDRLGVDDWRLSTAAPHRKKDGMPYANANPDDPGVVVRWSMDGDQFAVACDHYTDWRDNARSIALYIEEKRKMSDRPVTTGQSEFATARLPSGDEDATAAEPPAHAVLGVDRDATDAEVRDAYRDRLTDVHPDHGGSEEQFKRVKNAKEAILDE